MALLVQTLQSTKKQQLKYSGHKHQIQKTRYRGEEKKRGVFSDTQAMKISVVTSKRRVNIVY